MELLNAVLAVDSSGLKTARASAINPGMEVKVLAVVLRQSVGVPVAVMIFIMPEVWIE
jgi:hypothetical protein